MKHSNDVGRARRWGRQIVSVAQVVLAAVGWVRPIRAVDTRARDVAPGTVTAGPVDAIGIDPYTSTTLYVGTQCSGVFKSIDGGASWGAINNGLTWRANGFPLRLAIDPITPGTLYSGTYGAGVFKSTDAGATWGAVNRGLSDLNVSAFGIDPITPGTLYAGTFGGGVFRSGNGGSTWRRPANAGLTNRFINALAIDPTMPDTLYAGTYCCGDGVFWKSTQGGDSWALTGFPIINNAVPALAIDPRTSSTLYAGSAASGVFKSTDAGTTWSVANAGLSDFAVSALAIDPITPGALYGGTNGGVFKSTDGGSTWHAVNSGLGDDVVTSAIAIDPTTPATLYTSTGAGVFKSTDSAETWHATAFVVGSICGDGILTCQEECDDGNTISGDGCDANCTVSRCGNGIVTVGEECDDGNGDSSDGCTEACTICGNGIVTSLSTSSRPGEQCDDGNRSNNDACTNACRRNACGDGFLNPDTEKCDDGNLINGHGCDSNCTTTRCGNGVVSPGEECDDDNTSNTDACRNDCKRNVCGDGFVNPAAEKCDDGNLVDGDGCDSNCTLTACGNGIVTPGEECDDGNRGPYDGCTNDCTICGDRIVTPPEECDDGNTNPFDGCTTACTMCGNGSVVPPERCDDGNLANGDGCDADCIGPGCGDGHVDADEDCDGGGICVGGADAGTPCTSQQCLGGECQTFGGNGCAANCTTETARRLVLDPGASEIAFQAGAFRIPLQVSGRFTLRLGRRGDSADADVVPLAVRAEDISFAPVPIADSCLCISGTENSALGEGISGTGSITCTGGFPDVDVLTSIDHNSSDVDSSCAAGVLEDGSSDHPHAGICNGPEEVQFSGSGAGGSIRLNLRLASWSIPGGCQIDPGRDGIPCTNDDPGRAASFMHPRGFGGPIYVVPLPPEFELRLTTGMASAEILDANNSPGQRIAADADCGNLRCMTAVEGARLNCEALTHGGLAPKLAGVTAVLDRQRLEDLVATFELSLALPVCAGDCHGDGQVTIDELITGVTIALGSGSLDQCASFDTSGDDQVTVDELIAAVSAALGGCG